MDIDNQQLEKIIKDVNEVFYDEIFEDEWFKDVFVGVDIDIIKSQQTDFILGALGGPKRYGGRSPKDAHPHIFIQEDMWKKREEYLLKAFEKNNTPEWIRKKWLAIDEAFKRHILKDSLSDCHGRYRTEEVIYVPNPFKYKKSA